MRCKRNATDLCRIPKKKISRPSLLLSHLTNVRGNKLNWNKSFWERHPLVLVYTSHIISRSFPGSPLISWHQRISLCVPALALTTVQSSPKFLRLTSIWNKLYTLYKISPRQISVELFFYDLSLFSTLGCLTAKKNYIAHSLWTKYKRLNRAILYSLKLPPTSLLLNAKQRPCSTSRRVLCHTHRKELRQSSFSNKS
jgi:hypothetical protein